MVISRLPHLMVQMLDFPTVEVEKVGDRRRLASFHRIPQPLEAWLKIAFETYTRRALEFAGAERVMIDFDRSETTGREVGLAIRAMRMHVQWS